MKTPLRLHLIALTGLLLAALLPARSAPVELPPLPPDAPPAKARPANSKSLAPKAAPATPPVQVISGSPKTNALTRPTGATPPPAAAILAAPNSPLDQAPAKFDLLDGDRVVFLGDTLIEREQTFGYLETRLTVRYPDRHITFRNLGFSADLPNGQSRVSFDWNKPEEEWFKQLMTQINAVRPTVVFLGYGMAASFAGEAGLPKFKADIIKLIEAIQDLNKDKKVRFAILSPLKHENLGPPWPDPKKHNEDLIRYGKMLLELAKERSFHFVNLYDRLGDWRRLGSKRPITDNGIHLNAYGYLRLADAVEMSFGWLPNNWRVGIQADGKLRPGSDGMEVTDLKRRDDSASFNSSLLQLPSPILKEDKGAVLTATRFSRLQIVGLKPGNYTLLINGEEVSTASDQSWKDSRSITSGPMYNQVEQMREVILKKNELFFHRWRPENQTYLFGFRKYEQGQNAREIPMFDPLVEEQEKIIAKLRKPVPLKWELLPAGRAQAQAKKTEAAKVEAANSTSASTATVSAAALQKPYTEQPLPQFDVAPELEITLFAENPQLAKPIAMNFDPQGRLWVASSSVYPQIEPGAKAEDKILILEDTNGDGKAEKSTVFADGLLIPTGVEPGNGGCYVGQSTELLFFKDTNGDGHADEKRIVLSGFGTEDTHHILHTLRWGPDGQLYMNQSIYIHTHTETPHGVVRLNSGGLLHLRPATMQLGVFLRGFCNPWGHSFDEFGQSFVTDGAGGQGINFGVPGAMYFTYAGARRELQSVSPGNHPKYCGLETIYSQHFPDDWQGSVVTCDFRANRVVRFAITEQGSGFAAKQMPDLLRTTNVTFRPIDVKLGPDGALYIADWSNPIINHGEVDFRDPRRDHVHGRIWRVAYKGRPLVQKTHLAKASNDDLLGQLLSPNGFNRQQSRRVLTERGTNIVTDLYFWSKKQLTEKKQLEALWMYQSINQVEPELLKNLLKAEDGRVRAAATRVLSFWQDRITNSVDLLAERIADEHPRVRLEAMRALSKVPSARAAELALSVLDKPMDAFLDYGVWLTINDLAKPWLEAVQSGAWKIEGREQQLQFGLKAVEPALAGPVLAKILQDKPLSHDGRGSWIELIGQAGGPSELRQLFDKLVGKEFEPAASVRALAALNEAKRLRNARPSGDLDALNQLFSNANETVQTAALRLAGAWKLGGFTSQILKMAGDKTTADATRQAAFAALRELGGSEVISGLHSLSSKRTPDIIRRQAVVALAALDVEKATPETIEIILGLTHENDTLNFWRALLDVKGAGGSVAKALPKSGVPGPVAQVGMRVAREGGRKEPALITALASASGLEKPEQEFGKWEFLELASRALREGDPARGEKIYRRTELACMTCHAIGGAGGKVGPDMTSLGASAPMDYLIESILLPNSKIKEGFHSLLVQTKNDEDISGILVRETNEELILRNAANQEISVPKNNIKSRANGASLMPSGLVDNLTMGERLDMFRFLSELGKPGPFDASRGNVARVWKVFNGAVAKKSKDEEKIKNGDPGLEGWMPVYSTVQGDLLKQDLEAQGDPKSKRQPSTLYASTKFQVANAGPVKLKFEGLDNAQVWIDGKPIKGQGELRADLPAGVRTIVLKLDSQKLADRIRLESNDGTFLTN